MCIYRKERGAAYDIANVQSTNGKGSENVTAYENFAFGDINVPAQQHSQPANDVTMEQNPSYFTVHY